MTKFFTTDKIIAIGLILALIISFFVGENNRELQNAIAVGLIGYLGKVSGVLDSKQAVIEEVIKQVTKKGGDTHGNAKL